MPKTIKKYIWLFEWIAASLILALGLVIGFVDGVVLLATGISLVLIAILLLIAGNGVFDIIKILDERKQLHQQEEKEQLEQNYEDELRRQVEAEIKKEQEENDRK